MAKLCDLWTKTISIRILMVFPFIKQISLNRFISRAMTEIWITSIVRVKNIQGFCVFWSVFYDGIHEQFSVWAFTFSGFEVRWLKKVQVAWFASPLAGIEPVQSGVTMAVSSTGFQLATCPESGERETNCLSWVLCAGSSVLHNAIVPPGYTVTGWLLTNLVIEQVRCW